MRTNSNNGSHNRLQDHSTSVYVCPIIPSARTLLPYKCIALCSSCALACACVDVTECEEFNNTVTYGKLYVHMLYGTCTVHRRYCIHLGSVCFSFCLLVSADDCYPPVEQCGDGYCVYGDCINGSCTCFENTTGVYCETVLGMGPK